MNKIWYGLSTIRPITVVTISLVAGNASYGKKSLTMYGALFMKAEGKLPVV
jgi:hypothetical protein